MEEWFRSASLEQRDAMVALQLDYRFKDDGLSGWWQHLQHLGFAFVPLTGRYRAPRMKDETGPDDLTGGEVLSYLDSFGNTPLTSTLQDSPETPKADGSGAGSPWGERIRNEVLFLKFRDKVTEASSGSRGLKLKQKANSKNIRKRNSSASVPEDRTSLKRPAQSGAEMFLQRKASRSKSRITRFAAAAAKIQGEEDNEEEKIDDTPVIFPNTIEYISAAQSFDCSRSIELENDQTDFFTEWQYLASTNHSLLFYGAGSKTALLNRFAETVLKSDGNVLVVDGFDQDMTVEAMLMVIVDYWLDGFVPESSFGIASLLGSTPKVSVPTSNRGDRDVVERAIAVSRSLAKVCAAQERPVPYYIVLHNIDGKVLRNPTAQEALAALASNSAIPNGANALRLVASIDHVNSPCLLWDPFTCASFSWIWNRVDTFRPHVSEIPRDVVKKKLTKPKREGQIRSATSKSLLAVLSTLAPRHAEVLQVLANLQRKASIGRKPTTQAESRGRRSALKNKDDDVPWVRHADLLSVCQLKLIASSDQKLKYVIKELNDQSAVVTRQSGPFIEHRVPYDDAKLVEILSFSR